MQKAQVLAVKALLHRKESQNAARTGNFFVKPWRRQAAVSILLPKIRQLKAPFLRVIKCRAVGAFHVPPTKDAFMSMIQAGGESDGGSLPLQSMLTAILNLVTKMCMMMQELVERGLTGVHEQIKKLEDLLLQLMDTATGASPTVPRNAQSPFREELEKNRDCLTVHEFAVAAKKGEAYVRELLKEERLLGHKIDSGRGGKLEWRIPKEELKEYVEKGPRKPKNPYRFCGGDNDVGTGHKRPRPK